MIDKIIEIEVYGRIYKIRVKGEEDEKYISHLTAYVDQKMQQLSPISGGPQFRSSRSSIRPWAPG